MNRQNILLCILTVHCTFLAHSYNAVISAPVADIFFYKPTAPVELECSSDHQPAHSVRLHQLLFNTPVQVLKTEKPYVMIKQDEAFCINTENSCTLLWTEEKNIVRLPNLSHTIKQNAFPSEEKNNIVLIRPFYDEKNKQYYSAGTIFRLKEELSEYFVVNYYERTTNSIKTLNIPHERASQYIYPAHNLTHDEQQKRIKKFVQLLRSWAHPPHHTTIPYVLGGTSYCQTTNIPFKKIKCVHGKIIYKNPAQLEPYCGFDCSGLIMRAALTAGIPYHYKNTSTLRAHLKPCISYENLQDGDLVFIPGHVLIVSNKEKNLMIEAAGYGRGYGCVHEKKLSSYFKHIHTYHQLFAGINNKKTFTIIDKYHAKNKVADDIVVLSLDSVWHNTL